MPSAHEIATIVGIVVLVILVIVITLSALAVRPRKGSQRPSEAPYRPFEGDAERRPVHPTSKPPKASGNSPI